jgi:hypothetical protein
MLYKNDEPYRLAPNDVKTIKERFKKFPLIIKYPPERIKKSRTKENKVPDQPTSISFDLFATVKTNTGADLWRYAENVIIGKHGIKKYTPRKFRFTGLIVLKETDIELAWFLYTKSPYCQNGLNAGKSIKFIFEDKINEAEARAEMESIRTTVKALIWGKELGLSEKRLRDLAKAYFINNVDELTFAQVKMAVESKITSDPTNGYQKFIEMTRMDEIIKTRVRMQTLMDAGIIIFDTAKRQWKWKEAEKGSELICKIAPAANPNDTLYDYFMGNSDFQEMVEIVERTKLGLSANKEDVE